MATKALSMYDPDALTTAQRWGLLGASLRDIGSSLNGGDGGGSGDALANQQALISQAQTSDAAVAQRKQDAADAQRLFPGSDIRSQLAQVMYASGNPKFREALASSYEARALAAGGTFHDPLAGLTGAQTDTVAPVLRDDNGSQTTQYADHSVQTGQAAPSYGDQTARINATVRTVAPGGNVVALGDDPNGTGATALLSAPASASVAPGGGDYMSTVRQLESSGNDAAQNGSSTGRYQFQPKTFAAVMPGGDINNPADQDTAMQRLTGANRAALAQGLGRAPTDAELYLAHQQGAGGALALLRNPNAPATSVVPAQNITSNGGTSNMTAGQFAQKWMARYARAAGGGSQAVAARPQATGGARVLYSAPTETAGFLTPQETAAAGFAPGTVVNRRTGAVAQEAPASGDESGLNAQGIEDAAQQYAANGVMPPLGQGKAGTAARTAILNRAAQIDGSAGMTGAASASRKADFKSAASALSKVSGQISLMEPAAQAALSTLDQAIDFAKRTGSAAPGVPFLSGAIQAGRINGLHDPNATQFRNLVGTAASEYAKVIAGSTGSAPSSDATQREARSRLNEGMTLGQLINARKALATEMSAKIDAVRNEQDDLRQRMTGGPSRSAMNQQLIQRSQQTRDPLGILGR